jgi:hypothetical protein
MVASYPYTIMVAGYPCSATLMAVANRLRFIGNPYLRAHFPARLVM